MACVKFSDTVVRFVFHDQSNLLRNFNKARYKQAVRLAECEECLADFRVEQTFK